MQIYRELKSSYDFRFSDERPNPVSHIAIYFPGFGQDAELLKQYAVSKGYVEKNIERSYCVTAHRVKNNQPRRFLSLQSLSANVALIFQQVKGWIDENNGVLTKVTLVGHSLGALYASRGLNLLLKKYPHLKFDLHELPRPPFMWRAFLHTSFLMYGGFIGTLHALLMMILNVVTLGSIVRFRGYRTPAFAVNGLFLNNLVDQTTAAHIAKHAPPDATLAFFQAALCYGFLSSFRYSEVFRARQKGWRGKHFVYAAKDDRVFRYCDIETYARDHGVEVITLEPGYSNGVLAHMKSPSQEYVTHCPFY